MKNQLSWYGYAEDKDINDYVTSIEVFFNDEPSGIRLFPNGMDQEKQR